MQNTLGRKGLAIGIILLFVWTSSLVIITHVPLCNAGTFHDLMSIILKM